MPFGLSKGFLDRLRERIKTYWSTDPDETPQVDRTVLGPASGKNAIMHRIQTAARNKVLLYMQYNNTWRHVEPYSYRYRSAGLQPLFFGHCVLHDEIHAFRIDRIQDVEVTDRPFTPRHTIEIK